MGLFGLLATPFIFAAGWLILVLVVKRVSSHPNKKRICLLIAHCDDEAMFFSPAVLRLTEASLQNHLEILCLSNGEDPGLRTTRTDELFRSASNLGLKSSDDVTCLDDADAFPDSMTTFWSPEKVSRALATKYAISQRPPLDMIITFDHRGISSHANHISLLHGARHYLQSLPAEQQTEVALYSLVTTNIVRKYITLLDAPLSLVWHYPTTRPPAILQRLFFVQESTTIDDSMSQESNALVPVRVDLSFEVHERQ
ncbi:N-acetylglucosaminyl-phosphatidylinositol de-N-acetylase-like protein 2 [Elsinoe fawcettii]|nr:N-acetylglucosaminyl-phosphatidylinositol de-N-acetylase-like protein 2 [Elsinoe fawcettii]